MYKLVRFYANITIYKIKRQMKNRVYIVVPSWDLTGMFPGDNESEKHSSFKEYLDKFKSVASNHEFEVVEPQEGVYGHKHFEWSGTPELRAKQLEQALRDDKTAAIFSIGGGGGSKDVTYILNEINNSNPFPDKNIPFIGISDSTPIGLYLESINAATHVQGPSLFNLLPHRKLKIG